MSNYWLKSLVMQFYQDRQTVPTSSMPSYLLFLSSRTVFYKINFKNASFHVLPVVNIIFLNNFLVLGIILAFISK